MAKKMFEVEIRNNGPKGYETAVSLRMPATWSEFHDALQKARIKDGRSCGNELLYVGYDGLQRGMIGRNINLYDLNLLAQRLTALTPEENTGMEALLAMEWSRRRGPVSLEHLINLTYNTDVCCLAPQVSNLQELGAFLYESEMLSNEAMALLDTMEKGSRFQIELLKLLGEQHKEDHGGVFTKRGYAELGGEIRPVYAYQPGETTYFQRSGAPVVLEVRKGFFNDPQYDNDKTAILNLPAIDKGVRRWKRWRPFPQRSARFTAQSASSPPCGIPSTRLWRTEAWLKSMSLPVSLPRKSGPGVRQSLSDTRPSWRPAASPAWGTPPSFWRRRSSMNCSPRWRKPGTTRS